MDKEKMIQIYETMADMTLDVMNFFKDSKKKNSTVLLDEDVLEMVRTTQSLYETLNHANQAVIATASEKKFPDCSSKSQYGCTYTGRTDATDFGDFVPRDSSGTKYSPESSSIARPTTTHEQNR